MLGSFKFSANCAMTLCISNLSATTIQRNRGRNVGQRQAPPAPSGFPRWFSGKGSICSAGDAGDLVQSLVGKIPRREGMETLSRILTWEIPWTEEPGGL